MRRNTMDRKVSNFILYSLFWIFLATLPQDIFSAPLPQSTQKILKKLKLDPALLAGIDKELKVPNEWIEKAKK